MKKKLFSMMCLLGSLGLSLASCDSNTPKPDSSSSYSENSSSTSSSVTTPVEDDFTQEEKDVFAKIVPSATTFEKVEDFTGKDNVTGKIIASNDSGVVANIYTGEISGSLGINFHIYMAINPTTHTVIGFDKLAGENWTTHGQDDAIESGKDGLVGDDHTVVTGSTVTSNLIIEFSKTAVSLDKGETEEPPVEEEKYTLKITHTEGETVTPIDKLELVNTFDEEENKVVMDIDYIQANFYDEEGALVQLTDKEISWSVDTAGIVYLSQNFGQAISLTATQNAGTVTVTAKSDDLTASVNVIVTPYSTTESGDYKHVTKTIAELASNSDDLSKSIITVEGYLGEGYFPYSPDPFKLADKSQLETPTATINVMVLSETGSDESFYYNEETKHLEFEAGDPFGTNLNIGYQDAPIEGAPYDVSINNDVIQIKGVYYEGNFYGYFVKVVE